MKLQSYTQQLMLLGRDNSGKHFTRGFKSEVHHLKGHVGINLQRVDDPDAIKHIDIDRRTLPRGNYVDHGYESRQRFDIRISRHVTEYRAQVLENERGKRFVAPFPPELSEATQ